MKNPKPLKRIKSEIYHFINEQRVEGTHEKITGNVSGLWGDVSDIRGNVSGIRGNMSDIPLDQRPCLINDWVEE